jgi:hypothetical protein
VASAALPHTQRERSEHATQGGTPCTQPLRARAEAFDNQAFPPEKSGVFFKPTQGAPMANIADAELILKLYDLRREAVCRQARSWFAGWKPDAAEAKAVLTNEKPQENAYLRQATSFWEMAFSIANSGAVDQDLFAKNCGEGVFFATKCQVLSERLGDVFTRRMGEAEAFIGKNKIAGDKVAMFRKRI